MMNALWNAADQNHRFPGVVFVSSKWHIKINHIGITVLKAEYIRESCIGNGIFLEKVLCKNIQILFHFNNLQKTDRMV